MYGQGHNPSAPAGHLPLHKGGFTLGCRGEQCSPVRFDGSAKLPGASGTPPPTTYMKIGNHPGWADDEHRSNRARVEIFGPEGVNAEGDGKALRKMQHSCIF